MYHQLNFSGNECTALAVKKLTCNPEETRQLYEAKKAQTLKLWNRSPPMLSKPNVQQLIGTCSKFVNEINSHICAANQTSLTCKATSSIGLSTPSKTKLSRIQR